VESRKKTIFAEIIIHKHKHKMNEMKTLSAWAMAVALTLPVAAQSQRQTTLFDDGWKFTLGHASQIEKDFMSGTEYFNYLTKAHGIHNEGPYSEKFDDSAWQSITLPHDWVTRLPYAPNASHSHGYRSVGYKFPENSVGWYRKSFEVPAEALGQHIELQFDGIFRNATLWVNGIYMGVEPSGYASQTYDITDYLNYGGKNIVCVRADASLEEGWFYEGAGIYRDVWMHQTAPIHVRTWGTFVYATFEDDDLSRATLEVSSEIENSAIASGTYQVSLSLLDAEGNVVASTQSAKAELLAKEQRKESTRLTVQNPHLWDVDDPYLYTLHTDVLDGEGQVIDATDTRCGIRDIRFTADEGFFLNGRALELKGVNCHQDHAGVGAAIPDALQAWRIRQLKAMGCNAYRASHNPMTPALLDVCDSLGMLVIDENRLMGLSPEHLDLLERMIRRDRNHPSVILWSDGNEEWGLENSVIGTRMAASMREHTHRFDPSRPVTIANAGGTELIKGLEVVGYNYIVQNDVENRHRQHPEWKIVGTEETTACGTRGIYFRDPEGRWMPSINRTDTTYENIIERGWKFYDETPWASGLFYWTGFDYRGEPNPLSYPCVGSQFGLLDYCGFPKDEAYYLKAWWTQEPVLHIFPHWNLQGHEGERVDVWAYSNCEEVELWVNGKSMGRQSMPRNGHLKWQTVYRPGRLRAVGYNKGRRVMEQVIETTGEAAKMKLSADRTQIKADNRDVAVITVELQDRKGRFVPTACNEIEITLEGPARILGVGNGDSAFKGDEHPDELNCQHYRIPAFNGLAQILVQSQREEGMVKVTTSSAGMGNAVVSLETK